MDLRQPELAFPLWFQSAVRRTQKKKDWGLLLWVPVQYIFRRIKTFNCQNTDIQVPVPCLVYVDYLHNHKLQNPSSCLLWREFQTDFPVWLKPPLLVLSSDWLGERGCFNQTAIFLTSIYTIKYSYNYISRRHQIKTYMYKVKLIKNIDYQKEEKYRYIFLSKMQWKNCNMNKLWR